MAIVLYTVLLPTILLLCGLAIDLSILWLIQTRLSAAVDGAALGAGRLLGTNANTTEIAGEFLNASFPTGYWGTTNLVPNITLNSQASLHTISVTASVQAPLMFLRILRQNSCTVAATATAVRRDVRVELVLDRSYSMVNQMSTLRSTAANFVNMFIPGHDEMGLVILSGSSYVAYPNPTQTPNYNYTGGNGPDVHFADAVTGSGQNMLTTISNMQVGTDTNTSEAIWLAYLELKKAISVDNDPTKANIIVLFTDGVPNGFTAYLNDPSHNSLSSSSNCYYNPSTGSSNQQIGWIATAGNNSDLTFFSPTSSTGNGFYSPLIFNSSHSNYYWAITLSGQYVNDMNQVSGTPMTNCRHIANQDLSGLAKIPSQDYYGTSTSGTAYTQGVLYKKYNIAYDNTQPNNGYHMGLASWNIVDNAAQKILADTNQICIYTIGFTGDGGVDAPLLNRVANTQIATSYNSNYQTGTYVEAADAASLQNAFWQVASQILRLTH